MSGARIVVDPGDPTPPYEQVRAQVVELVARATLAPGERLPSVRQLASDLGLAAGTVARAYRELETAGVVVTRRGAGTRVAASSAEQAAVAPLERRAADYVAWARAQGYSAQEIRAAVRAAADRPG